MVKARVPLRRDSLDGRREGKYFLLKPIDKIHKEVEEQLC